MGEYTDLTSFFKTFFVEQGMAPQWANFLNIVISLLLLGLQLYTVSYLTKRFILKAFKTFTTSTKTSFDDFLVVSNFPRFVSYLVPLFILIFAIPLIFEGYEDFLALFTRITDILLIILGALIVRSLMRTSQSYLRTKDRFRDKPLESYAQVLMIFVWAIAFVFIFSEITGKSVVNFLISLGAASAIILLIFKDTILGFVASIQVSVNDIVRIGDWITFNKFGADGFVTEINLATVKVQNWDKTYTTIPTYSLIADSFQNWRGMEESPGRRIKRSLFIKQSSVGFVTEEDLEKYKKFSILEYYLTARQKEIDDFNKTHNFDRSVFINGRNQTNLGIFRKYADAYLHRHPGINQDMSIIVRHLDPTSKGIPLELYCFSNDKRWVYYEEIAADIFDHLIAAIPYFDLKLFEEPTGDDVSNISKQLFPPKEKNPGTSGDHI